MRSRWIHPSINHDVDYLSIIELVLVTVDRSQIFTIENMVRLFEKMFCHFRQLQCVVIFSVVVKVMRTELREFFGIY
jgi:hypothetical protein